MGRSFRGTALRLLPLALLAYVLQTTTVRLIVLQATNGLAGHWPIVHLRDCPTPDIEAFRARLIPTPRLAVADFEECFRAGEAMRNPLICELPDQTPERLQAVTDAIKGDREVYATTCRPGHDGINFITRFHREEGSMESILATPGNCGAGFIFGDAHQEALHRVLPYLGKNFTEVTEKAKQGISSSRIGTSFVTNFPEARVSAASHASSAESIAYQLAGQKVWLLHDHEESAVDYVACFPTWAPNPSCLDTFTRGLARPFVAVTRPGDALFFPFAYQHTVYTDAGPSVMTNVRKIFKPSGDFLVDRFSPTSLVKLAVAYALNGVRKTANPRKANLQRSLAQFWFKSAETRSPEELQANANLADMLGTFL